MTNNTRRPRCIDCHRVLNSANATVDTSTIDRMCDDCYDLAGLEAAHQDGDHDDAADADCLMCNPDARADRSKPSNKITTHTRGSHAACYAAKAHDKTREGRAGCRKLGGPKA